jgi:hypothetical protein
MGDWMKMVEMEIHDTEEHVFEPVTTEMSAYEIGVEATLRAVVEDLCARGLLDSMATDVATTVRARVYGVISAIGKSIP